MGQLHASRKKILTNKIPTKAWIQVCSNTDSIDRYLTKVGCVMSATRKYDYLIFTHKFSSSDYIFVYAADDNKIVGLIHTTLYGADTTGLTG